MPDLPSQQSESQSDVLSVEWSELSDHFKREWNSGASPQIEDVLREIPRADSSVVFQKLLRLEVDCRTLRGDLFEQEEY